MNGCGGGAGGAETATGRVPQEQALAGVLAERCGLPAPQMRHRTLAERRQAFAVWAETARQHSPPGRLVMHHTAQRAGDISSRYRRARRRTAETAAGADGRHLQMSRAVSSARDSTEAGR